MSNSLNKAFLPSGLRMKGSSSKALNIVLVGIVLLSTLLVPSPLLILFSILLIGGMFFSNVSIKDRPLTFVVFLLTYMVPLSVVVKYYIFSYQADSWRAGYVNIDANLKTIEVMCAYLYFFAFVAVLSSAKSKRRNNCPLSFNYARWAKLSVYTVVILITFVYLIYVSRFYGLTRHEMLLSNIESKSRLFELVLLLLPSAIVMSRQEYTYRERIFWCVALSAALLILLLGERAKFLSVLLAFFLAASTVGKFDFLTNKRFAIFFILAYYFFFIVSIARLDGMSIQSVVSAIGRGLTNDTMQVFANHEENIFFSMSAIIQHADNDNLRYGATFLNAVVRLLPDMFFQILGFVPPERVSVEMAEIINPGVYEKLGLSYGSFYLAEIYWNFGVLGTILSGLIIPKIVSIVESSTRGGGATSIIKNVLHVSLFISVVTFVYYGSSNYVIMLVASLVVNSVVLVVLSPKKNRGFKWARYDFK